MTVKVSLVWHLYDHCRLFHLDLRNNLRIENIIGGHPASEQERDNFLYFLLWSMVRVIWGSENEKWLLDGGGDIDSGDFNKKKEDDGISLCCFSPAGKKDQLQICRDFYLAFIQSILRAKNNWTLVESLIFALVWQGTFVRTASETGKIPILLCRYSCEVT